jgi:hypothetical protein
MVLGFGLPAGVGGEQVEFDQPGDGVGEPLHVGAAGFAAAGEHAVGLAQPDQRRAVGQDGDHLGGQGFLAVLTRQASCAPVAEKAAQRAMLKAGSAARRRGPA